MTGCSMATKRMGNDLITGKQKIGDISNSMKTATTSTKALGVAMNVFANVGFMLAITAISKVVSELAQAQENAVQAAKEATETYNDEISSIDDYKTRLYELHEELNSGNLSYEETKTKRAELMSIQDELIEKFGTEKGAIKSVTEAINGQVDALDDLNEKSYRDWVAKADKETIWTKLLPWGKSGLDQAIDYMETNKTVSFYDMVNANSTTQDKYQAPITDEIRAIQEEIDKTIQSKYNLEKEFATFKLTGTPDEIKSQLESIRQDYLDLSKEAFLKNGISSEYWDAYRSEALNSINEVINSFDEGLKKHQETYQTYIEGMIKYDSEYSDEYATILQKRAELESAENSGNEDDIKKARQEFMDAINSGIKTSGNNKNVKKYFESLYPELQAEFANWDFEFSINANTDGLADQAKEIGEKYSATDLFDMINTEGTQEGEESFNKLIDKAIEYGVCTDNSAKEVQKLIDLLVELGIVQEYVQGSTSNNETVISSFKEIWKGLDDKVKDKLLELAKAGELTLKTFKNTEGVDGFIKQLKELGISAEESVQKINKMADSASQLSNMQNAISSLSENLYNKQQNPSEAIGVDVLNGMSEDLKACTKEWNKYIITLGTASSSTEEVQQVTDRLATAYVNSNNFLANLTDKTQDYYISQLDAMGVENAREVVLSALAMKESESIAIKIDLTNKTWDEITATNEYIKASNLTRQALAKLYIQKQLLNSQELKTANDIQNLINLAKEADITGKYIKRLMEIKSLYQSQENYLSNHQGAPVNFIELDKYKKKIQDIANTPITSDVDVKIDTSGSKSAMSDAKKSAKETKEAAKDTKTAIDWISQSLKVLQQNLDLTKAKFENLFTIKEKKNNVKQQIKETKLLLDQTRKSANAYEKELSKAFKKLSKPIKSTNSSYKYNGGKDLISIAESQLGYSENGNNNTKYGAYTGNNFAAWCQSFVSWVANQAGLNTSQMPKTASTDTGMEFFQKTSNFGWKGKYTPKRNDTVYFKSAGRSHVGLVKDVKNGKIYTIEGNSSNQVRSRSYSLNDKTITGYGKTSQYFDTTSKNTKKKVVEKGLTKKEISELEQLITLASKKSKDLDKSMLIKKYGQERAKQIQDIIGINDNLADANVKIQEYIKNIRELNKELPQIDIDNYNKILDKQNAKLEVANKSDIKSKILKNQLSITRKLYDTQIKQAKIDKDSVKIVQLRYEKEKAIYDVRQAILQTTLDENEKRRSLNEAKRNGSSTAKVQGKLYEDDIDSYNSDIKAYKKNVKAQNQDVSNKAKKVTNTKNFKKLTKADKNKIKNLIKKGQSIPSNLVKKAEKISKSLATKMDNYNMSVEIAKTVSEDAELGIQEALNNKSEAKASKYDAYADEYQSIADAYSAQSYNQYKAKDKEKLNKNIQSQMDEVYKYQIKAAKERGDYVLVTKLQAEWNKDKLDRKLESMQNYIDEKQAEMDLNDTYVEGAKSAWEKGVYLSRNKKIIQEQAEIEAEMLKKQGKYVEAQKVLVNAKQRQLEIERQIHSLIADAYDTLSGTHNTKADISTNISDRLSNNIASMMYAQKSYDEKIKAESDPLKVEQLEVEKVKALNEAWMTAIGSIEQYFDRLKSDIETEQTHIQSMISLLETHGSFVNADMYTSLAEKETEKRKMALTEIKELQEYISKLPVGSDEWYDAQEKIKSLTKTAEESAIQFEEFSHKAIEAANAIKEFGRNAIGNLSSEADFYKSILAYSDLIDEDAGFFTKEGMATLALSADKISNNAAMVQKLNEAIEENEKLYVQGKIGFKEYTENYEKLNSERQNAILNVYAEKDAIKQLIEEAYNKQLQSLDDLIAKYKKALQAEKSLHDYQKNIEKQTKNLVTLQKRLAALQGDTSEEAKAKIQKLQVEIADAQDELDETEYSKYIEDQETMLDAMKEEYENFIKDQMDNATALVEKLIKELPMSAEEVTKVLQNIADENNTALSTALKTATQNGQYSAITKEVNSQGSQIATELSNLAESLASQDTLYSRTLDELTNIYNNENIIATSLPDISTILGEIKTLIATKETQIIINAEEQASQNDIPENPPSQPITTPTPQEKPSESTNNQGTAIENAIGEMTNIKLPDTNNQLSGMNEPTKVVVLKNKKQMLKEVKDFISEFSYTAPRKKSEYSKLNQYIYEKTDGEVLGDTELQKLAKKLGVTPGAKDDDTWKNKTLNKLKQVGYSQGGVVGALQRIPGENGDEGWATLKRGEAILTPEQTEMFKQFTSYLPEFNNPTKFDNIVKNYDVSKFVQKPKLDIGGINVTVDGSNITDAETFAKELPRAMINAIQKDKQCRMAFQDIGVGQLMGTNKSYMRYK